jgi:transcriptional regulator with XRE-family HTH domain
VLSSGFVMTPEQVKQLRKDLDCSCAELAATLGLEPRQVRAWEAGEAFPTKRHTEQLLELAERGPEAVLRSRRGGTPSAATQALEDARLWRLVRQLVDNPLLIEEVQALLAKHERR